MAAPAPVYLAVDFGGGSGRLIAGILEADRLRLEEVHRFSSDGLRLAGTWHWNVTGHFQHILDGLKRAARTYGDRVRSVGIDTWGGDYGLIDAAGSLLGLPVHYRDSRTAKSMEQAFALVSKANIYAQTGNQFMPFNSLFQLIAEREQHPGRLSVADRFLMMPDLFNFWLTGRAANEATNASTTQLVNPVTGDWAWELIDCLGFPRRLFHDICQPGTVLGPLLPELAEQTGLQIQVVAVGSHDTASAYAAVPATGPDRVYLSSGTWSLLGTLSPGPVITDESFALSFTNERAVGGEIRLLKNICGMWLMQECKRIWDAEGEVAWDLLINEAEAAPPFVSLVDPDDPRFAAPCDMPARLREACAESGQPVPKSRGALSRMVFESLALKYRVVFDRLAGLVGRDLKVLHVVGGGCRNRLLNQFTANALGREVIAGPVEATAAGNILCQMQADGQLSSQAAAGALIARSFEMKHFQPRDSADWAGALQRFRKLLI